MYRDSQNNGHIEGNVNDKIRKTELKRRSYYVRRAQYTIIDWSSKYREGFLAFLGWKISLSHFLVKKLYNKIDLFIQ